MFPVGIDVSKNTLDLCMLYDMHRLAMGNLYLPVDLPEGACRELTAEELNRLQMHES